MSEEQQSSGTQQQFGIQKIYVKDASLEVPNAPQIFTQKWEPHVNLELHTNTKLIADDVFDVEIALTVTVNLGDKTAYLIEVKQAGIFTVSGFADQDMGHMLGSFCPNILFPYARETISDMVTRAGFPQLLLAPVNFDAVYAQQLAAAQQPQAATPDTAPMH